MDRLEREDLVVVAMAGDYGKPRPALVARARIGPTIGHVADDFLLQVNRALALWVGIAA